MRLVLEKEAYAKLDQKAKAEGKTTRELGISIIKKWLAEN